MLPSLFLNLSIDAKQEKPLSADKHRYFAYTLYVYQGDAGNYGHRFYSLGQVTDILFDNERQGKLLKVRINHPNTVTRKEIPLWIRKKLPRRRNQYIQELNNWLLSPDSVDPAGKVELSLTETGSWSTNVHPRRHGSALNTLEFTDRLNDIRFSKDPLPDILLNKWRVYPDSRMTIQEQIEYDSADEEFLRSSSMSNKDAIGEFQRIVHEFVAPLPASSTSPDAAGSSSEDDEESLENRKRRLGKQKRKLAPIGAAATTPLAMDLGNLPPEALGLAMDLGNLPPELVGLVVSFLDDDPCEQKWVNLCKTDQRLAVACRSDAFWHALCDSQGWAREDRTTGWHDKRGLTWQQQFFKWCKLRFGPFSEEELKVLPPPRLLNLYQRQNEAGLLKLAYVVDTFLEQTAGTGVLDKSPESYPRIVQEYGPMNTWDVSQVKNMIYLFLGASSFNAYIGDWDTSNVTDMGKMFNDAISFNNGAPSGEYTKPLKWNTSEVRNMSFMFFKASAFNADISKWNVSNVWNMEAMFKEASAFNNGAPSGEYTKPLEWNTSEVNNMAKMFMGASAFNADISGWDVSKVRSFRRMFVDATMFNQNLENWHQPNQGRTVNPLAQKYKMFFNSGLTENNRQSWSE